MRLTFLFARTKSVLPSSRSKSISCRETVGWETWRSSAAWVMLPSSAVIRKYSRTRKSTMFLLFEKMVYRRSSYLQYNQVSTADLFLKYYSKTVQE